ncbi:unnamed protein product [Leptosia nina]|uniref:Centrosome-associated zinc finger protein CP190 n=1 Tax=Leptosia nina TaxID=320188 RepID=A0AAV1IYR8_9NEOP
MSDIKQVKVDNWGIYFLQRLKHFFNRTDYCDLTLQFQDNAQLKVHRLVLNSCTEYFELLERTCEMYSDCLIMPDDLQADVVVPIVNFMYTGQLEFKMDLLEKLYQTSLLMSMPILTKLLDAHRTKPVLFGRRYSRSNEEKLAPSPSISNIPKKRTFTKAFQNEQLPSIKKKHSVNTDNTTYSNGLYNTDSTPKPPEKLHKKYLDTDPKPTRYELPAELDDDNVFENSFTSLSYESKPLMVHPETTKYYTPRKSRIFDEPSSSKGFLKDVECRKITQSDIFDDVPDGDVKVLVNRASEDKKDTNQLFDQILTREKKISIEKKENKDSNLDHAKIISEVLKKYPHLVKSNKNIKLKILNNSSRKKVEPKSVKPKMEIPEYTYESDVVDSQEAARLIALGAENVKGPWICLICGTPGRALHFTSYYNYRRHLVDIHNEKPVSTICEYCGLKSLKRNYLVHHLYTKHGVDPPRAFNFPKCNACDYVALSEALLIKHKLSHGDNSRNFRCTVCAATFHSSNFLLQHIQKSGHKFTGDKKPSPQCIYCFKVFARDPTLYVHLKTCHYELAKRDGVIEDSDDERDSKIALDKKEIPQKYMAVDAPISYESQFEETSYQFERRSDGKIEIMPNKPATVLRKKILNADLNKSQPSNSTQKVILQDLVKSEFVETTELIKKDDNNIVLIDNKEYILTDTYETENEEMLPKLTTKSDYSDIQHNVSTEPPKVTIAKSNSINQPIQIVVSNEEEYKALLSSQHSIIFEDGASEKALAVLTAANTSNVGDTINLDTAQPNDMMILPQNYPLNITEANTTDSSNIVVVYSHPVNEANKHYQLITSSGIEGQFVQSSAIFTQNFETVATASHVAINNNAVNNSWPENIPIVTAGMQVITSDSHQDMPQIEITQAAVQNTISKELSNVQESVINNEVNIQTISQNTSSTNIQTTPLITEIPTNIPNNNVLQVEETIEDQSKVVMDTQTNVVIDTQTNNVIETTVDIEPNSDASLEQHVTQEQSDYKTDEIGESVQTTENILYHQVDTELKQEPLTVFEQQQVKELKDPSENTTSNLQKSTLDENAITQSSHQSPEQQLDESSTERQIENIVEQQITDVIVDHHECEESLGAIIVSDSNLISIAQQKQDTMHDNMPCDDIQLHEIDPKVVQENANGVANMQVDQGFVKQQPDVELAVEEIKTDDEETIENIAKEISIVPTILQEQIEKKNIDKNPVVKEIATLASEWSEDETEMEKPDEMLSQDEAEEGNPKETEGQNPDLLQNETEEHLLKLTQDETGEKTPEQLQDETEEPKPKLLQGDTKSKEHELSQDETKGIHSTHELQDKSVSSDIQKNPGKEVENIKMRMKEISSLLNDWEDNDTQEETETITSIPTGVIQNTTVASTEILTFDKTTKDEMQQNSKPCLEEKNIRNLVSDWDEDDEEENKV